MNKSHDRFDDSTTISSGRISSVYLPWPRFPLRLYSRSKVSGSFINYMDFSSSARVAKRPKNRKTSGMQKKDFNKKKGSNYTEMAYQEAISKLKYLLSETYVPKEMPGIFKAEEDMDDHSIESEKSKVKNALSAYGNLAFPVTELRSVPPEITAYIEQQEKYIEQMEQESQYCREELTNLLSKVREVIAENEELHNKNKSKFLKRALEDHENSTEHHCVTKEQSFVHENILNAKLHKPSKVLEGSNIIFESRITELEAQLTQAKLELRKVQEENRSNLARLSKGCLNNKHLEIKVKLDEAVQAKYDAEIKLEELQKTLSSMQDNEIEFTQKTKQLSGILQQMEFEKNQAEAETRRLKDELDRQHEKFREVAHETSRRIAEEREQIERKYNHKVEQLSADVVSHWDVASRSQLETEKQRRELMDLKTELSQKQTFADNLKKELRNKISRLESDLNQALTEKNAVEQEVLATKLAAERSERQAKQEQNRLQVEINSYKQRLERVDVDLVHCRRENLRLVEQIASLEKEISVNRIISSREDSRIQDTQSKQEEEKQLNSAIMDMEVKHVATVAGIEDSLNKQAKFISQLTAECQSLTQRLEANDIKHKNEMASLQNNIEYLSSKIKNIYDNQEVYNLNTSNLPNQFNENNISTKNNEQIDSHVPLQSSKESKTNVNVKTSPDTNELQNNFKYSAQQEYTPDHNANNIQCHLEEAYKSEIKENTLMEGQNMNTYIESQQYDQHE